jgi:hypothetical protein
MLAVQFEFGPVVVERADGPPVGFRMAIAAVPFRIKCVGYKALVFTFMAIHAPLSDVAEMPFTVFLVARNARRGFMCTCQLELRRIVTFEGIGGNLEPVVVVALGTIRRFAVDCEFPLVDDVLVAIRAFSMLERLGHVARGMALLAFQLPVQSQ